MIRYKGKTLTNEQESHINTILTKSDYAIQAPPGSGKTFLLLALARKMPGCGLSISFNKILAVEASKKFCRSVTCKTGHSLAYGAIGYKYKDRLKKLTGQHLASCEDIGDLNHYNTAANKGYLILNTIRKFCYSSDLTITKYHVPQLQIMDDFIYNEMTDDLVLQANNIFSRMANQASSLPITHDIYLKLWALSKPSLQKDYIFFDEYQDSNPVISQVIKSQDCQKIFVGDQFQQIYSWRGAVNALTDQSLKMLYITQSFRFGSDIANLVNKIILSYYPYDFKYIPFNGNIDINSSISYLPINKVDCIICRTNKGVITETINALATSKKVHILGGTKQIIYLIKSIESLKNGKPTTHPDLFLFKIFTDLQEYANSSMGGDLKSVLKLLDQYNVPRLLSILRSTTNDPAKADITITTAHKSKGLEWPIVKLANDFKLPSKTGLPTLEETNILYVAASRALLQLDLSACQACSPANLTLAKKLNYENYIVDMKTLNK